MQDTYRLANYLKLIISSKRQDGHANFNSRRVFTSQSKDAL